MTTHSGGDDDDVAIAVAITDGESDPANDFRSTYLSPTNAPTSTTTTATSTQEGGAVVPQPMALTSARSIEENSERPTTVHKDSASIYCLAISKDGKWLASGHGGYNADNYDICIFKAQTQTRNGGTNQASFTLHRKLQQHTETVRGVDFSEDASMLASCGADKSVVLWKKGASGEVCYHHEREVHSVKFMPQRDGATKPELIASCGDDHKVILWNIETKTTITTIEASAPLYELVFHPTGNYFACACDDGRVLVGTKRDQDAVEPWVVQHLSDGDTAWSVSFSPDGEQLACSGRSGPNHIIETWDISLEQRKRVIGTPHKGYIWCIVFSPNSVHLATASFDNTVGLFNSKTGQCLNIFDRLHSGGVYGVVFTLDGSHLVSGSSDKTITEVSVSSILSSTESQTSQAAEVQALMPANHASEVMNRALLLVESGDQYSMESFLADLKDTDAIRELVLDIINDSARVVQYPVQRICFELVLRWTRKKLDPLAILADTDAKRENLAKALIRAGAREALQRFLEEVQQVPFPFSTPRALLEDVAEKCRDCNTREAAEALRTFVHYLGGKMESGIFAINPIDSTAIAKALAKHGFPNGLEEFLSSVETEPFLGLYCSDVLEGIVESFRRDCAGDEKQVTSTSSSNTTPSAGSRRSQRHSSSTTSDAPMNADEKRKEALKVFLNALTKWIQQPVTFPSSRDYNTQSVEERMMFTVLNEVSASDRKESESPDKNMYAFLADGLGIPAIAPMIEDFLRRSPLLEAQPVVAESFTNGSAQFTAGKLIVRSSNSAAPRSFWEEKTDTLPTSGEHSLPTFLVTPFPNLQSSELVDKLMNQRNRKQMTESMTVRVAIDYKWDEAQRFFHLQASMYFLSLFCLSGFTVAFQRLRSIYGVENFSLPALASSPYPEAQAAIVLGVYSFLCFPFTELADEILQLIGVGPREYFTDLWNLLDIVHIVLAISLAVLFQTDHIGYAQGVLCAALYLRWIGIVYYLQLWESTGLLASTILQASYDIGWFVVMLLLGVVAAAFAFYALENQSSYLKDPRFIYTFLFDMFNMLVLNASYEANEVIQDVILGNHVLKIIIFVGSMVLVPILLLNLLIAKMSESYDDTRARGISKVYQLRFDIHKYQQWNMCFLLGEFRVLRDLLRLDKRYRLRSDAKFFTWLRKCAWTSVLHIAVFALLPLLTLLAIYASIRETVRRKGQQQHQDEASVTPSVDEFLHVLEPENEESSLATPSQTNLDGQKHSTSTIARLEAALDDIRHQVAKLASSSQQRTEEDDLDKSFTRPRTMEGRGLFSRENTPIFPHRQSPQHLQTPQQLAPQTPPPQPPHRPLSPQDAQSSLAHIRRLQQQLSQQFELHRERLLQLPPSQSAQAAVFRQQLTRLLFEQQRREDEYRMFFSQYIRDQESQSQSQTAAMQEDDTSDA